MKFTSFLSNTVHAVQLPGTRGSQNLTVPGKTRLLILETDSKLTSVLDGLEDKVEDAGESECEERAYAKDVDNTLPVENDMPTHHQQTLKRCIA